MDEEELTLGDETQLAILKELERIRSRLDWIMVILLLPVILGALALAIGVLAGAFA